MRTYGDEKCAACGQILSGPGGPDGKSAAFTKCIRCGLKYCDDCWQPDFVEICPRCCGSCS